MKGELVTAIATEYCNILRSTLSGDAMDKLRNGEGVPCDYCDGNEVMAEAFEALGVSLWTKRGTIRESSRKLWNAAFEIAKAACFTLAD